MRSSRSSWWASRKSFDVALHAGAMAAWLLVPGAGGMQALRDLTSSGRRQPRFLALSVAIPAAIGLVLESPIERRLGTPVVIASGLTAGSLAMLAADRRPETRAIRGARTRDGLWLGLAQASALIPGVSRSGATEAVARFRSFSRSDSRRLAAEVGLPVIAGATILKGVRAFRWPQGTGDRATLAVGAGASFSSALALAPLLRRRPAAGSLAPYALYRLALAAAILARPRLSRAKTSA
jgi:undecaprenyl-diphosphatase